MTALRKVLASWVTKFGLSIAVGASFYGWR